MDELRRQLILVCVFVHPTLLKGLSYIVGMVKPYEELRQIHLLDTDSRLLMSCSLSYMVDGLG